MTMKQQQRQSNLCILALVALALAIPSGALGATRGALLGDRRRDRSSNNSRGSVNNNDDAPVSLRYLEERLASMEARMERRYQDKLDEMQQQHEKEMQELEERLTEDCERMVDEAHEATFVGAEQTQRRKLMMTAPDKATTALSKKVKKMETSFNKLSAALVCLDLENSGKKSVHFKGCNVHIENGQGNTDTKNGLGNLILGYDEDTICISKEFSPPQACIRDGSHNLVVGMHHEYGSYGGIVAGEKNSITGIGATVVAGYDGLASGNFSSIGGGLLNWAAGEYASVQGGEDNAAFREYSSISGGFKNDADGAWTSILGGDYGLTLGDSAIVVGGFDNVATASFSIAVGGAVNVIESEHFVVLGGNGTFVPAGDNFDSLPRIFHQVLQPDQAQCACLLPDGTIADP